MDPHAPSTSRAIVQAVQKTTPVASTRSNPRGCPSPWRALPYEPTASTALMASPTSGAVQVEATATALLRWRVTGGFGVPGGGRRPRARIALTRPTPRATGHPRMSGFTLVVQVEYDPCCRVPG